MARTRKRYFSEMDKSALLEAIGECRKGCIRASSVAPINEPIYRTTSDLMKAIDDLASVPTGDREYFHLKIAPTRGPEALPKSDG